MPIARSLEPCLRRLFSAYGHVVYKYRLLMIVIPLCLTAISVYGLMYLKELSVDDSKKLFTPTDGRWVSEAATFRKYWPLDNNKFLPGEFLWDPFR